jgi:hypothetical protein
MFKKDNGRKWMEEMFKEGERAHVVGGTGGRRRRAKRLWVLLTVVLSVAMLFSLTPVSAGEAPSGETPSGNPAGVKISTNVVTHRTSVALNGRHFINGLDVTVKLGVDAAAGQIPLNFTFDDGGTPVATQVTVNTEPYKDYEITFYLRVDYFGAYYNLLFGSGNLSVYPWTFTASDGATTDSYGIGVEGGEVDADDPFYADPEVRAVGDRARPTYALTVNGGTGSGNYAAGTQVMVIAGVAPEGKVFDAWTGGDGGTFANAGSATTVFTMPAAAATVTATYKDSPADNGNGSGGAGSGSGGGSGGDKNSNTGGGSGSGGSGDNDRQKSSGTDSGVIKDKAGKSVEIAVSGLNDRAWTGKQQKPKLTVTAAGKTLKSGTDYALSYGRNKDIGIGTVTLTGKGDYADTKTFSFRIMPKKMSVAKVVAGKKQITVTWKKTTAAQKITKYQVRYRAKGTSKWTTKTLAAKTTSLTVKKLKKGKTYEVQVSAYKKIASGASKGTYYGDWSKTKASKKVK